MAQAVCRRPLTAEGQIRSEVNPCEICGEQIGTGTGVCLSISSACCASQKSKRAKRGNRPKSNAVSEMREHWAEKDLHFVVPESIKAMLVFQMVEKLSSLRGVVRKFTKTHLCFCPLSDVSWPLLLMAFIRVSILCFRLRLFLPIGLFLSRFCAKTSHVFITFCATVISLQGGLVDLTLKVQTGGPPFLGCPPLIFQCICKNCSH
jgi:hypothetical protein